MKTIARSASITHLQGLSGRALTALSQAGLRTVGELVDLAEDDLIALPNIGVKLAGQITKELNKFHIVNVIYTQPDKHAIAALKETDSKLARIRGWLGRVEWAGNDCEARIEKLEARNEADGSKSELPEIRRSVGRVAEGVYANIERIEKLELLTDRGNQRGNNLLDRLHKIESAVNKLTGDATLRETRELVAHPPEALRPGPDLLGVPVDDVIEVSATRELPQNIQDLLWMPESANSLVLNRHQLVKLHMYLEGQQDLIVWHEEEQIRLKEAKGLVIENSKTQGDELNLLKETLRNLVRD